MADLFAISENDLAILRGIIDREKRTVRSPRPARPEQALPSTPEVYIAKVPTGGIAGLGAGSLEPSYADCDIYRLSFSGTIPTLTLVGGLSRRVFNLSSSDLAADSWPVVLRDKFGDWLAPSAGTTTNLVLQNITGDVTIPAVGATVNVTVTDGSQYTVGQWVQITNGTYSFIGVITNIATNVLTVENYMILLGVVTDIITSAYLFVIVPPGVRISNGVLDFFATKVNISTNLTLTNPAGSEATIVAAGGGGADIFVKVSGTDTTTGYLEAKLLAGVNWTLTKGNPGANETLTGEAIPSGADTEVQFNDGDSFGAETEFTYDKTGKQTTVPGLTVNEDLRVTNAVSESISGDTDDLAVTDLVKKTVLNLTGTGGVWTLTGLDSTGIPVGFLLWVRNIGSFTILLPHEDSGSAAANRWSNPDPSPGFSPQALIPAGALLYRHDGTRWNCMDPFSAYWTGAGLDLAQAADVAAQQALLGISDAAADISITDTGTYYTATDVEGALQEAASGLATHLADTTDAHDASAISIVDADGHYTATNVEAALDEAANAILDVVSDLAAHLASSTAHDADEIWFDATGLDNTAADDVQAAIADLDAAITAASGSGGKLVARYYAEYTTNTTLSTTIPFDDTIPQSSEGTEILTVTLTPASATNRVRVRWQGFGGGSTQSYLTAALFWDSVANALCTSMTLISGANHVEFWALEFEHVPGDTSAHTYKIRVGAHTGSMKLNGDSSTGRLYGGSARSTLVVEEIVP